MWILDPMIALWVNVLTLAFPRDRVDRGRLITIVFLCLLLLMMKTVNVTGVIEGLSLPFRMCLCRRFNQIFRPLRLVMFPMP
jgi:hypothetical protein